MRNPRLSSAPPAGKWGSQDSNPTPKFGLVTSSLPQLRALHFEISRNPPGGKTNLQTDFGP